MADSALQGSPAATSSATTDLETPGFGVSGVELRRKWLRGVAGGILGAAFGVALVVGLRAISGLGVWQTEQTGYPHIIVPLFTAPLGFLLGFGAFDYWLRWGLGMPSRADDHADHGAATWRDYFTFNTDHKVIGIQYIVTTFFFFFVGGLIAMVIRAELAQPGTQIVGAGTYNSLFSTHAAIMIFLFVIPVFAGIANYVLPLMLGAPDMAFPRLNALSFWLLPLAGVIFLTSFLVPGGAFDAGWTGYAPLSTGAPLGQSFFNVGLQFAGFSSILAALNFLVTIVTMRAPGMTFWRMPLLVWANFATSLLVVAATPFLAGVQFMVLFDRILHTNFFQFGTGGNVISYQHIFWFYSHPAVYIMIIPGFGIVSEVISTNARKPIFGYRLMSLSLLAIIVLSYSVWAHHMLVAGMFSWLRIPMMLTSVLIAIPTGIKIFSWVATLFFGKINLRSTSMLFALGFICSFILGGISGVMIALVPIDIHVTDTYFIVAHIHFVLFAGSVFTIFAGIYYWFPKVTGRMYDERLGKIHFWLTLVGTWGTFVPMHWIGMDGMPRRVADYASQFGDWNLLISCFSFMLGAAQLVFLYNMVVSWRFGPKAGANPWRARTIEWQVSSPPPRFDFDRIPRVVGGPYEFGVPGAVHVLMEEKDSRKAKVAAGASGASAASETATAPPEPG
jgi:cytochrome c oxidase subunit 1